MWTEVRDALQQSLSRTIAGLAGVVPGIAALLLALVAAAIAGWILARVATGILGSVGFDARIERLGLESLADWAPGRSPTRLVGRLAFWAMMLLGCFVGLTALDATIVPVFAARLINFVPNVFAAAILLVAGSIVARYLSRGVLISAVNMQIQSARLLGLGVKWMVLLLAAAMALNQLSIGGEILSLAFGILFGGIVLALALAVGLGSKDVVSRTWEQQATRGADAANRGDNLASHL